MYYWLVLATYCFVSSTPHYSSVHFYISDFYLQTGKMILCATLVYSIVSQNQPFCKESTALHLSLVDEQAKAVKWDLNVLSMTTYIAPRNSSFTRILLRNYNLFTYFLSANGCVTP